MHYDSVGFLLNWLVYVSFKIEIEYYIFVYRIVHQLPKYNKSAIPWKWNLYKISVFATSLLSTRLHSLKSKSQRQGGLFFIAIAKVFERKNLQFIYKLINIFFFDQISFPMGARMGKYGWNIGQIINVRYSETIQLFILQFLAAFLVQFYKKSSITEIILIFHFLWKKKILM